MPRASLISLNVILCEKILREGDQVYSAVRITDIFYFRRSPTDPTRDEPIPLNVLVIGKTMPEDTTKHSVQLILIRPDNERQLMGDPLTAVFQAISTNEDMLAEGSKVSDIAGGFTIEGRFTIIPRQVGRHQIVVELDGELVARVPFTILELKSDAIG